MVAVFAHRGASAAAPENTVEAFRLAGALGADWVELDARRSADGAVVVHHDARLADSRLIVETVREALPASVPTLASALDACAGMGVNIEIKNLPGDADFDASELVAHAVVAEISRRSNAQPLLVSSFHLPSVDRVAALDPAVPTALLVSSAEDPGRMTARTKRHGHRALNPWHGLVDAALMAAAHADGLAVNAWTVDDPARMAQLAELGVDGIVTNVPDVARRVVDDH